MSEQERPQGQQEGKRPNNALDEWKLRLLGPVLEGAQRQSSMRVAMISNQLRFQVFTNLDDAPDKGMLQARMSSPVMNAFLIGMEQILAGTRENIRLTCQHVDDQKQRFLEITVLGGRTEAGEIFIGFAPEKAGAKPCRFMLTFDEFHQLLDREGEPLSKREHSDLFAAGWLRVLRDVSSSVLAFNFKDRNDEAPADGAAAQPAQQSGGYQGGGNSGGNNGGYQKKQWGNQGGGNGYQKKPWNKDGNGGGNNGGYQKKPWQGGNGGGGNGGYQKKPWNKDGNGGGNNGGYQKKPWQGNQGGNGGGGNNNQSQGRENTQAMGEGFDDNFPF